MPGSPYTDLDRPPLDPRALRRALVVPGGFWTRIDVRRETGSTNADAVAAAGEGTPEGLVVVAERQTAGRGRLGRQWSSPPRAGIAASVLLRPGVAVPDRDWPPAPVTGYGWLPLLAGVALAESVLRLAELPAELKWPNDLLVGGAKCAGILAESVPSAGNGEPSAIVVGIGLNVTLRADELPTNPGGLPATSLRLAGAAATDRDPLLRALLRGLADWYGRWRAAAGDADECGLRDAYLRHCATVGREVRVSLPGGETRTGTATSVDGAGRLVVDTVDGPTAVAAGDVLHLR
ncbi:MULTISPECIES: biotin--[acetyl-CoA-carboxylase] ligase [Polymorphospora]|uniref:biotin--[biotin carboxyl-carrier protein] ligase n=1 Tax=Polymorphospora lycopeni TaxID=3140240 RepID=A0ABV5CJ89_9ACTN